MTFRAQAEELGEDGHPKNKFFWEYLDVDPGPEVISLSPPPQVHM